MNFDILGLLAGLALFLFGMDVMGDALKKSAGSRLKTILGKMTSNPVSGFLLGLGVTAIIQSSSATTVMVVGFVNSGTMTLLQAVGVIMGANVGTAVTAWLTALSGINDEGAAAALEWIKLLKPDSWMPILAIIGVCLILFVKRGKKKDIGYILIGFSVLMVGMSLMSDAVGGLKDNEAFKSILTMFENPILGVLAGMILTAIVQSSSASIGILQSLSTTGAITYGMAIPIILGQNIGTCITAMLSSIGANKNGKRAAVVHLYFNIIGVVVWLSLFYIANLIFTFPFMNINIDMWGIAGVHTIFKILSVLLIAPFYRQLERLARLTVREKEGEVQSVNMLDERLFETPAIAVQSATRVAHEMAAISAESLKQAMALFAEYDPKVAEAVRNAENKVDVYEDTLGSYLVKLSSVDMTARDSMQITKLLHIIGDLERISDHALNIAESAEEMRDKKLAFSDAAREETSVAIKAIMEAVELAVGSFAGNNIELAMKVEPLEQVVDNLCDIIKGHHILRLKNNECTIELGFILSDVLANLERISDHCSNIASCIVEIAHDSFDMHSYTKNFRSGDELFDKYFEEYSHQYTI